jgi:hypothetical protein
MTENLDYSVEISMEMDGNSTNMLEIQGKRVHSPSSYNIKKYLNSKKKRQLLKN